VGELAVRTVDGFELGHDRQDLGLLRRGDAMHRRAGHPIDQPVRARDGTSSPAPHPRRLQLQHPADALERPARLAGLVDHRKQLCRLVSASTPPGWGRLLRTGGP
jgi:hypothetical protein